MSHKKFPFKGKFGSSDSSQGKQESSDNESEEKTSEDETGSVQDLDEEEGEVIPKVGRSDVTELPMEVDNATQGKKWLLYLVSNYNTLGLSGYSVHSLVSKPKGEPICTLMYVCQTFTSTLDQINWNVEVLFAKELKVLTNVRERFHVHGIHCMYGICDFFFSI